MFPPSTVIKLFNSTESKKTNLHNSILSRKQNVSRKFFLNRATFPLNFLAQF